MAAEGEAVDTGGINNHLENVLSIDELSSISEPVINKVNKYIDTKFEEYLTSKALHETSRSNIGSKLSELENTVLELTAKYEEYKAKAEVAEKNALELEKQVTSLNSEMEKARDKILRMENELLSMKSARDAAVDEKNDLMRIVQRRDTEIERLTVSNKTLSDQLQAAIGAKCEALSMNDDIQSKELNLQYKEKRMEQERILLNSQITALTEEVNRLSAELQTHRLNQTSRLVGLESKLAEKIEELNTANTTIAQLNELKANLNNRAENLAQRLAEQREMENKMEQNYKKEIDAKTKLAELFKSMQEDAEAKTLELTAGITELQKLVNEATEKCGDLETKYKQAELDHEDVLEKKNEVIASLKTELEHANDLLKAANAHNLDMALGDLAPTASAASKLIKSGMSLTQVYSQLVKVSDELSEEKEENRRLRITINSIVQELEDKAPTIARQKAEFEEALESNLALTQQAEALTLECNRLRDEYSESNKLANHYTRENARLKGELADLGRQVCFLLKEIEHSRKIPGLANGEHDSNATDSSDLSTSNIISKNLVTFTDIQELQANNQKLLRMVRDLTDKQEEADRYREQFDSGEMQKKLNSLESRVTELTEAQERQTKMVNGLIRQRDMFKKLYHDLMKGKRHEASSVDTVNDLSGSMQMDTSTNDDSKINAEKPDVSAIEVKLKETEKQLELLKEDFKTYREEKITNEKMLYEQIDNMRQENSKLIAANSKSASTAEYNSERLKILQTNIATYKKQITSLEEKNKVYSETIAKHEVASQHLRDEALNAQSKLATAEVTLENLKMECKLLKDTESRLQMERDMINRERQGQALLLNNLECIKVSLERSETEGRLRLESRLDEANRECAALRRRLQEEQDRFRELTSHLERQTEIAKNRMQEEKDAADSMRIELTQLRNDLTDKCKANEELARKLKVALTPNKADGTFDALKRVKDLESQVNDKVLEIQNLQEQLKLAKEHIKQYCDISECAEKELKALSEEYASYKSNTQDKICQYEKQIEALKEKCAELEAELSIQSNGQEVNSSSMKNEFITLREELKLTKASLDSCKLELDTSRSEITRLSQAVQVAEDKYAHEMMLHSSDIQALTQLKEELTKTQQELNELRLQREQVVDQMEANKSSWSEREKLLTVEKDELLQRLDDVNKQNAILHEQVQALGTQLSVLHASKSASESMTEGANDSSISNINVSLGEDENRSNEQLFQIIKYLRKEKDIAVAKCDILEAENQRLKAQLEITEKKVDEFQMALAKERENSEISMVTSLKQSDILRKVETLDALTDSNRVLREERDSLVQRLDELSMRNRCLEEQLMPLQEKITDLTSKNDTLTSENSSLKADAARWRTRVNALVERANKTSPEDWKRLQNERETLAKMLTSERETVRKLSDEMMNLRVEKSKLEDQHSLLSRQHSELAVEVKRVNDELQSLKGDVSKMTDEMHKTKNDLNLATTANSKLTEDLAAKEAALTDIRNKEAQIRKIAKRYKQQFEDLTKTVEEEKKSKEGQQAATDAASAENLKRSEEKIAALETQFNAEKLEKERLASELDSLKSSNLESEKAKQVLKQAKMKIVQLTEAKNNLTRELNESRTKIESIEQSNRDEQDVRLALIKSQYEGRLSRLEKEKGDTQAEKNRELEALQQKVLMLQKQLANQGSSSKQQASSDKPTSEPPTANIKPMAGVAQTTVKPPLASIRPMAQVGPSAPQPHDAHSTEYMPASSSRGGPRAPPPPPPESTQDMDTSEAGPALGASPSDVAAHTSTHSTPSTPQQAVALVLPRVEGGGTASASSAGSASSGVTGCTTSTSLASPAPPAALPHTGGCESVGSASAVGAGGVGDGAGGAVSEGGAGEAEGGAGVSTSLAPHDARPAKRARPLATHARPQPHPKRSRLQGFERSVDIEYQVPTSSRCDQEDDGVIVVDSEEDDDRCAGTTTTYQEGEGEEGEEEEGSDEGEEEQEEEGDEDEDGDADADGDGDADAEPDAAESDAAPRQESGAASPEAGGADGDGDAEAEAGGEGPAPHQQIEAITSGTEPSGLGGGAGDEADDSIVPSTPTLYVPRRNDGFGEAVVSPVGAGAGGATGAGAGGAGGAGGEAARFTFAESHHDTHADLAAAMPHDHPHHHGESSGANEEETGAVSSHTHPPSPRQGASASASGSGNVSGGPGAGALAGGEEGREAEASSSARRPATHYTRQPRFTRPGAEYGDGMRGMRGGRSRARMPRRPFMRY